MKIGVIGSGAWGCAISALSARAGFQDILIFGRDKTVVDEINQNSTNSKNLSGIKLPTEIKATANFEDLKDRDILFISIPSNQIREISSNINKFYQGQKIIIASKGLEADSLKFMSEVVSESIKNADIYILSGPNFADEIAKDLPAVSVIASNNIDKAREISSLFAKNKNFRIYPSDDIIGVQLCGIIKNIIAIASGITEGKKLGENAKAAVITRGLNEISRIVEKIGGRPETVTSVAGIGDLILTATSSKSRNMSLGIMLGMGEKLEDILNKSSTREGFYAAKSISLLAKKLEIELPITFAVNYILHQNGDIDTTIHNLLNRPISG